MLDRLRRILSGRFAPRRNRAGAGGPNRERRLLPSVMLIAGLCGMLVLDLIFFRTVTPAISGSTPAPSGAVAASALPSGAFTYAGAWTLLDLQQHRTEVVAISVNASASGAPASLSAKLTSGQVMTVNLDVTSQSALEGLRALGYGPLFTTAALTATDAPAASGGFDFMGIAQLAIILVLVLFVIRFMGKRMMGGGVPDVSGGFQIIDPPEPLPLDVDGKPMRGLAPTLEDLARPTVTMADVAGIEEAKRDVSEVIEFLKTPEKFHKLGAKMPRGLLFYGPPGTGKTLLAKAIATESGVRCIIASGAQFTEMFVGVGPKRVRELFSLARKMPAAIIFIDEFDSLAGQRGGINENSEDRKTVNELLSQMDGFRTTDNVVVIAATNSLEGLDAAAIRSGRFSRKIHVPMPDLAARREILGVHARNKPLGPDADLDLIARTTTGMSGADLAELLNEAAIFAARREATTISAADLRAAWLKVAIGTGRQRSMPLRERSIIAAHEAGHAICGRVFGSKTRVEEVSLFAHGMAGGEALGFTLSTPEDNPLPSESDIWSDLIRLMGGRAAEQILFRDITPGAANDLEVANTLATMMVTKWGMGFDPADRHLGLGEHGRGARLSLRVKDQNHSVSTSTSEAMERAIIRILDTAFERAIDTINAEMPRLSAVAAYLFEHERMCGEDFEAVYSGAIPISEAAIAAWRDGTGTIPAPIVERPMGARPALAPIPDSDNGKAGRQFLPRAMRKLAAGANTLAVVLEHNESKLKSKIDRRHSAPSLPLRHSAPPLSLRHSAPSLSLRRDKDLKEG